MGNMIIMFNTVMCKYLPWMSVVAITLLIVTMMTEYGNSHYALLACVGCMAQWLLHRN